MEGDSRMVYDAAAAEGYESLRRASPAVVQQIAAALGLGLPQGPARILDAGCGSGNYLLELGARPHLGLQLTGVDISPWMLARARHKTRGLAVGLCCADLAHLPLQHASCHGAYMVHALHHAGGDPDMTPASREARRRGAIAELRRVLAPGGRLCIVQSDPWQNRANCLWSRYFPEALERKLRLQPSSAQLAAWLRLEGFDDIRIRPFEDWLTRPVFQLEFALQDRFLSIYSEFSCLQPAELQRGRRLLANDLQSGELVGHVRKTFEDYRSGGGNLTSVSARRP